MKRQYELSGNREDTDVPTAWYGDVGRYRGRVDKARRAMEEYGCDLVEFFWAGEGEDEGFIEPSDQANPASLMLEGDDGPEPWHFQDRYDYEDLWMGPSLRVTERGGGTLYWYAKRHDAEITLTFRFDDAPGVPNG